MKVNQNLFAVSDSNVLITLIVTNVNTDVEDLKGWTEVTTKLADAEPSRHQLAEHRMHFSTLFIEPDGTSNRAGVFESEEAAIVHAEKGIELELSDLQSKIEALKVKHADLRRH
jgi:hypothetical protein